MNRTRPLIRLGKLRKTTVEMQRTNNMHETMAIIGYLLLFPGFFVYHVAIGQGILPDFASGLWGVASVCFGLFGALTMLLSRYRRMVRTVGSLTVVFLLVLYTTFWAATNYLLLDSSYMQTAVYQQAIMVLSWIALAYIGLFLPWQNQKFAAANVIFLIIMLVLTLMLFDRNRLVLDIRRSSNGLVDVASYQGFARSVLIVGFVVIATARNSILRIISGCVAIILLFMIGARSEFVAYITAASVLLFSEFLSQGARGRALKIMALIVVIIGLDSLLLNSDALQSRQLQVLDFSEASSWIERQRLTENAVDIIRESPLVGDITGHLDRGFNAAGGLYSHNILSAWVSLGIVGFGLYALACLYNFKSVYKTIFRDPSASADRSMELLLTVTTILLVVLAKPIFWTIPALAWGVAARVALIRRRELERQSGYR